MRINNYLKLPLAVLTFAGLIATFSPKISFISAQSQNNKEYFYLYFGEQIPLQPSLNQTAVQEKDDTTRKGNNSFAANLQDYLEVELSSKAKNNSKDNHSQDKDFSFTVNPIQNNLVLVDLPESKPQAEQIRQLIQNYRDTKQLLSVFSRDNASESLILPNEIMVSFQAEVSPTQIESILADNNVEIIRQLRTTGKRYLVKLTSFTDSGEILATANRLYQLPKIKSASPNFISVVSQRIPLDTDIFLGGNSDDLTPSVRSLGNKQLAANTNQRRLLPWQWHLDSNPLLRCRQLKQINAECLIEPVTTPIPNPPDLQVKPAWENSNQGKGVVVAVLDNLIQTHHPDLENNILTLPTSPDAANYPGERQGWDFVGDDNNTSLSAEEANLLKPILKDALELPDPDLLTKYSRAARDIISQCRLSNPDCNLSDTRLASILRRLILSRVQGSFHGTMAAGIIATDGGGLVGVAPQAKILPVRVASLKGISQYDDVVEGIAYAASRGADIINMSFGGGSPSEIMVETIQDVQRENPNLVLVASAGNSNRQVVEFPACIPGVISVGATNLNGNRSSYSSYGLETTKFCGKNLKTQFPDLDDDDLTVDVVAPGGDFKAGMGIITTGGTFDRKLWSGVRIPNQVWGSNFDRLGGYTWTQGTSFSAPAIAGVLALMKGEDVDNLTRTDFTDILKDASSYAGLSISDEELEFYQDLKKNGNLGSLSAEEFFFGKGLVDTPAAVKLVQDLRGN